MKKLDKKHNVPITSNDGYGAEVMVCVEGMNLLSEQMQLRGIRASAFVSGIAYWLAEHVTFQEKDKQDVLVQQFRDSIPFYLEQIRSKGK